MPVKTGIQFIWIPVFTGITVEEFAKSLQFLIIGCLFFFMGSGVYAQTFPARLVGSADVLDLRYGKYVIREFADLYNEHNSITIEVRSVTADTWNGHKVDRKGEGWLDGKEPIIVGPGQTIRIAERERFVEGAPRMNWWIRWIRFTAYTDRGIFQSNFISSPYKRPGKQTEILPSKKFDSLSAPAKQGKPAKTDDN